MSRKHFRILAEALGRDISKNTEEAITTDMIMERYGRTIDAMYQCNPNFNSGIFVAAILESAQFEHSYC